MKINPIALFVRVALSSVVVRNAATAAPPSSCSIQWGPCENKTATGAVECAKLPVPMDYQDLSRGEIEINLARLPCMKKPCKGSILYNPGGPGITGLTSSFLTGVPGLSDGAFDLVTWSPRGTGTSFLANCTAMVPDPAGSLFYAPRNATAAQVRKTFASAEPVVAACRQALKDTGTLFGSAYVARDMLRIMDGLGEPTLRYYGGSYGSFLGQIFAAMFPDKVESMVIDGVLNPHEYITGTDYQQLSSGNAVLDGLFENCLTRPSLCSLSKLDLSTQNIRQQFDKVIFDIETGTLELEVGGSPITYEEVSSTIFEALYSPTQWGVTGGLADVLYALITKNGTALDELFAANNKAAYGSSAFPDVDSSTHQEIVSAIRCSDVIPRLNRREDASIIANFLAQSSLGGGYLAGIQQARCAEWPFRAREQYSGNFQVQTRKPILVLSNIFDPATSIYGARNATATFKGSRLLLQNAYGHTSQASVSRCIYDAMREYFASGELPGSDEEPLICQSDVSVFVSKEELDKVNAAIKQEQT